MMLEMLTMKSSIKSSPFPKCIYWNVTRTSNYTHADAPPFSDKKADEAKE